MESAYIFGHVGNLVEFLGTGWSIEDNYAWAVGYESKLTLPLPGTDKPYSVRLTLHGLVNPGVRDAQRLIIRAGAVELGRFSIAGRATIEFALAAEQTAGRDAIELTLIHPDAMRPVDFLSSDDSRWLTLCFHSAGLIQEDPIAAADPAEAAVLPIGIVAGNYSALQLTRIVAALPSLRGKIRVCYVDTDSDLRETAHTRPDDALSSASFCWLQGGVGRGPIVQAIQAALPPACAIQRFGIPQMQAFWPFVSADPRAVREPGRYQPARYRFGDRIGASLAHYTMADDMLYLIYEGLADKEMPDLDALLAMDVMNWKRLDARSDIKIAAAMQKAVRQERLFMAPTFPGPALKRLLVEQLLDMPLLHAIANRADLLADLDRLMEGYVGRAEELPVYPAVARHFGFAWWNPEQRYRWHGNRVGFREYILDYIRWAAWRP